MIQAVFEEMSINSLLEGPPEGDFNPKIFD